MASRLRTRVKTEDGVDLNSMDLNEEERNILEQENDEKKMAAASQFRNIPFPRWLEVFLKV